MRKKIGYLFFIVVMFTVVIQNVYADDYKVNTLIPVNTVASVETDKFDYKNFVYNSNVDSKGNATIKFEGIQNNTLSKTAISINVLLFDENKKNIGFLTYCTDKDVSSNNAGFKIRANQVVPFTITVTNRYFVEGKLPKDVRFIAVRDENRYCQIGGYSNFKGKTIEEIVNGVEEEKKSFSFPDFSSYINMTLIIVLVAIIAVIGMIFGAIKLLKTMKERKFTRRTIVDNTSNTVSASNNDTSSLIDSEANKPLDLNNLYKDDTGDTGIINVPDTGNDQVTSIEDIFTPSTSTPPPLAPPSAPIEDTSKTDEETKAVPIESLYNSINELPEESGNSSEDTDNSINDLYNSINGVNDSNDNTGVSVDDLYESINNDDEDDDDNDE